MDSMLTLDAMNALADLCKPPDDDDSDSDCEKNVTPMAKMGPSDIGPLKTEKSKETACKSKAASKDIWQADEIPEGSEYDDVYDTRPQPEYDIVYKQAVTSEDMFLQMGNKSPATASCENLVVKIILPDTKGSDIKLDVKETFVDCRTPKYKLGLHLPHPVDHKTGRAQWDNATHTLSVTLTMNREYDFINF